MALSLKNRELEETARELASLTGKSITDALLEGAKRELKRQKDLKAYKKTTTWQRIQEIQKEFAAIPNRSETFSDDEILGYDEFGIPSK
jgi:antitoxin VapB